MQTDTSLLKLDINLIIPNKYQPRKAFDAKALEALADSIKTYGIINPILVRKKDDKYEIIAGERRFRAAKQVGLTEVPVIVKDANEQQMAELALIENLQRQDLNPIEEAKSYEEIMKLGNQTQNSLATKLGKSQSAIANKLRLLTLPIEIQDAVTNKKISERHARTLLTIDDKQKQLETLNKIITEKLTVKETESILKETEITEEEIKQAISEIMKSLNIEEEKEEKEDDNMNNGNFFPNFDNNNVANNNTSLNMMNMQSMNQPPMTPEPEVVMPTITEPVQQPQVNMAPPIETPVNPFEQFGPVIEPNMNQPFNPMDNFMPQQNNFTAPMEQNFMNASPTPTPQFTAEPVVTPQMTDVPLFNPNVTMPTLEVPVAPQMPTPQPEVISPVEFEVPVTLEEPTNNTPVDRLTELQNLLVNNGYSFKTYSNETDNCVIIELPKN